MCTATGRIKLLLAAYAAFICVVRHSCRAQVEHNTIKDCASSCGNIHNIAYPFRLNTDPKHCGTKNYQLSCENNVLMLYFKSYRGPVYGFPVQAINYNNLTIRLSEPNVQMDNCALPFVANPSVYDYLHFYWFDHYNEVRRPIAPGYFGHTCRRIIFINCSYPMTGSEYEVYNSSCNLRTYWYLKVTDVPYDYYPSYSEAMENSCRIEAIALTSLLPRRAKNISYLDVKNSLAYGFEISWVPACCYSSELSRKYNCSDYDYVYECYHHNTIKENIRETMTYTLNNMFAFLDKIKVVTFFSSMLASLNKTIDGQYYDHVEYPKRLTICGVLIHFLVAILAILERTFMLFRVYLCHYILDIQMEEETFICI